jgi:hypothetical protein
MFTIWSKKYLGSFENKNVMKKVWNSLPKYICWNIWLCYNNVVFNQNLDKPNVVVSKAKRILLEFINSMIRLDVHSLEKDKEV